MTRREYVARELEDIDRQLAGRDPGDVGHDQSDLGAIGAARYKPGITESEVRNLVTVALQRGRTWSQIGARLGMSAEEAKRFYDPPSNNKHPGIRARQRTGVLRRLLRFFSGGVSGRMTHTG